MGRRSLRIPATLVACTIVLGWAYTTPNLLDVTVDGRAERVERGTTLGQIEVLFRLQPEPGSLLDVNGNVIRAAATRGHVTIDGRPAGEGAMLHDGNRIRVENGSDETEPLVRIVRQVGREQAQADPQYFLESVPGTETITQGTISHETASVVFEAKGKNERDKIVALTFDDGPSLFTPQVLTTLEHFKVPATFFVVGRQVKAYPDILKQEVNAGMAIGNHTWNHIQRPPFAALSDGRQEQEMSATTDAIASTGVTPQLFRPPGGSYSSNVGRVVHKLHMRTVLWSVDPRDWSGKSTASIVSSVLGAVGPGSIVLLHDGGPNAAATAAAVPAIIAGIQAKGLRLVVMDH